MKPGPIRNRLLMGVLSGAIIVFAQGSPGLAQDAAPAPIIKLFSVGGVLTADGTLWQYSPSRKWQTIDDAFRDQGRETHILPLPVAAESIVEMVTFGFLRTNQGRLWLYDLEKDRWQELDSPR